jgi:hypothetical protein
MSYRCECGESDWCLPVKNIVDEQKFKFIKEKFMKYSWDELKEIFKDK